MRVTRPTANSRTSNVSSLSRVRSGKAFYKFSLFKNLFKKGAGKSNVNSSKSPKKRNPYILLLKRLSILGAFVFLLIVLAGCIIGAITVTKYSKELSSLDPNAPFQNVTNLGDTLVYSSNGTELKRISGDESRDFIKIEDVPDYVKAAFVAAEDSTFYENKGVDMVAIGRALISAAQHKEFTQGASTITQQVVKNTEGVGEDKSFVRKIKEAILSVQIAQKYSKDQVLQLYINSISFGGNFVGIKRAAQAYFNKDVKDLTYGEAALLAGIPNYPAKLAPAPYNVEDPYDTLPDGTKVLANIQREKYVLGRMNDIADNLNSSQGFHIDKSKIQEALKTEIKYNMQKNEDKAPHFTRDDGVVYKELRDIFKDKQDVDKYITTSALRVYTTLDYDMQQKAEAEVTQINDSTNKIPSSVCPRCYYGTSNATPSNEFGASNGAMISVDPKTGAVLTYVGSRDFNANDPDGRMNGQVDVIQSPVSQGSSMKPFNYLNTFLKNPGIGPTSTWANFVLDFGGGYKPKNFSIGDHPSISVSSTEALNGSLNIPAVQSIFTGGVDNYAELLGKMGYSNEEVARIKSVGLPATLGSAVISPWSHAQAYQTLVNEGLRHNLYVIDKVTDRDGNILFQKKPDTGTQVVDQRYAFLILNMLRGYPTVQKVRQQGYDAAGKTGTNDFGLNGYPTSVVFWGFTPDLITGMWAGNSNGNSLKPDAVGEKLGEWWWVPYMSSVLPKFPKDTFVRPAGIVEKTVCSDTGFLYQQGNPCPTTTGLFVDGAFPKVDNDHQQLTVTNCNGTILLASKADQLAGQAYTQNFVKYETLTGSNSIQAQIDSYELNVLHMSPPPTQTCNLSRTDNGTIYTKITSPNDGDKFSGGDNINIAADTAANINSAKFYFDSTFISESTAAPYSATYTIPVGTSAGQHTLRVQVTDAQGNSGQSTINIYIKGSLDPVNIQITSPSNNQTITKSKVLVSATLNDPNNQITIVKFYGKKTTDASFSVIPGTVTKSGNNYSLQWDLTAALPGQYEVYAEAGDGTSTKQSGVVDFNLI